MANYHAISAVGEALRLYLQSTYPTELESEFPCTFSVVATGELSTLDSSTDANTTVTLLLYRVSVNEQLRNTFQPGRTPDGFQPALPIDLHWMVSVWASSGQAEHTVFAWVLRQMADQMVLDTSALGSEAQWDEGDVLQVLPAELSIEDQMRVWDALQPGYRLSHCYVVRAVRLDGNATPLPRVVATRIPLDGGAS
ncbi:MAG: DUF4255 domain-containing protein [Myxococcales bacterium]|nr:DUF4255 domain-containing protein [Myxococcales bacterium]